MAGRRGGEVERDNVVTSDLGSLIDKTAEEDADFRAAVADAEHLLRVLSDYGATRRGKKLSQSKVAQLMGTTQSAISELEKGIPEPRISTLMRYARILGKRLRLMLVDEKPVAYRDRTFHYSPVPAVPVRADQRRPRWQDEGRSSQKAGVMTMGNVLFPEFRRKDESHLGDSIAKRIATRARA